MMLKHLMKNPKDLSPAQRKGSLSSLKLLCAIIASGVAALGIVFAALGYGTSSPFYYTVVQAQAMLPRIVVVVPLVSLSSYLAFLIYQAFENSELANRVLGHETNYLNRSIILATLLLSTMVCAVLGVMGK